jgi:hypothetical protein
MRYNVSSTDCRPEGVTNGQQGRVARIHQGPQADEEGRAAPRQASGRLPLGAADDHFERRRLRDVRLRACRCSRPWAAHRHPCFGIHCQDVSAVVAAGARSPSLQAAADDTPRSFLGTARQGLRNAGGRAVRDQARPAACARGRCRPHAWRSHPSATRTAGRHRTLPAAFARPICSGAQSSTTRWPVEVREQPPGVQPLANRLGARGEVAATSAAPVGPSRSERPRRLGAERSRCRTHQ